jgi:hypothetical protein
VLSGREREKKGRVLSGREGEKKEMETERREKQEAAKQKSDWIELARPGWEG